MYLECNAKGVFAIAFLGKKLVFHTEICEFRELTNFKNRSFSSGQGVVQSEPNWALSIPRVPRV